MTKTDAERVAAMVHTHPITDEKSEPKEPAQPPHHEPVRPQTTEEALRLLRERAALGRRAGFEVPFSRLPHSVQTTLYGIAAQLEYIAEFFEVRRD